MRLIIFLFFAVILIAGCKKEEPNTPPTIESIMAKPDSVFPMDTVQLSFTWNDPEGDSISTLWEAAAGKWIPIIGNKWINRWVAPSTPGNYSLSLTIEDTQEQKDCDSIRIVVMETNGTFIDQRDGFEYQWVRIGQQIWMAENLVYLPLVFPSDSTSIEARYYVYGYQDSIVQEAKKTFNYNHYGVLYNHVAASSACPDGWHLPSHQEWGELEIFLGMSQTDVNERGWRSSGSVGAKLKSKYDWPDNKGLNSSGFNALPSGLNYYGSFGDLNWNTFFWTSRPSGPGKSWYRQLCCQRSDVRSNTFNHIVGISVRCIKDY